MAAERRSAFPSQDIFDALGTRAASLHGGSVALLVAAPQLPQHRNVGGRADMDPVQHRVCKGAVESFNVVAGERKRRCCTWKRLADVGHDYDCE